MKFYRKPHDNSIDNYLIKIYSYKGQYEQRIKIYKEIKKEYEENIQDLRVMSQEDQEFFGKGLPHHAWDFFLNLVIGVKEVTYYLAECFLDGFGVTKDSTLANLTLSIGAKLGDNKSQEYLNKNNVIIPQHIDKLADKCVAEIKKYESDVKGRDVTWEEMVAIAKSFDYFVQKEHNISYYNSIKEGDVGMKEYCACIEPIIEENANIQVDMAGQESGSCCCCVII